MHDDDTTDDTTHDTSDAALADAVRDAVEAAVPGPTDAERSRMDSAVFAALAARGDGDAGAAATGPADRPAAGRATGAGTSCEAAPVPLRPGSRRKPSPRARGKRALPYFVAAAAIAVVLSVGISIIATGLQPGPSSDSAAVEFSVDSPNAETSAGASSDASSDTSSGATQSGAAAPTDAGDAPSPPGARSGTPGAEPELFLTNEAFADEADLVALTKRAPLATVTPEVARSELARTAEGLPAVTDLPACLAALPPAFVPMRVETGTWQGADVFFVSGSPVDGNVAVYVLARTTCAPVTSISLD